MRSAYTTLPNDKSFTIWFSMAPLRELPDMAFSLQSEFYLASHVLWDDPADDECHRACRRFDPRAAAHASLPKRPPGRITRTASITRYMKASEKSGA